MQKTLRIQGPINARLYTRHSSGDGMLSVAVEDVAPDGTVERLTGGWRVISWPGRSTAAGRATSTGSRSSPSTRTKAAEKPLAAARCEPVDVELPTGAAIEPGHQLRDRGAGLRRTAPLTDGAASPAP